MNPLLGPGDPRFVVTLVHGTFANAAPWTRPGSHLWVKLSKTFGKNIFLRHYDWSGNNSHNSRLAAATGLQDDLRNTLRRFPHSNHYVIAHSHGGNIVFYALTADDELRQKVRGVITMGTPFVICRARDIAKALDVLRWPAMPAVSVLINMAIIALLIPTGLQSYLVNHYGEFLGGFVPFVSGFIFSLVMAIEAWGFVGGSLKNWGLKKQKELSQRFKVSPFFYPPFLCGTVGGDEAGRWLNFVSTTSGLPLSAYRRLLWFLKKYGALLMLIFIGLTLIGKALNIDLILLCGVQIGSWTIGLLMYLLFLQIPAAILPKFIRAHRFGFGGESILDNWLNDISVERKPPIGGVTTIEIGITDVRGMRHSTFYDNEAFLDTMSDWMLSHAAGGR